ncbi:hypothetical protein PVAP13_9KG387700 [Panicum virgatum]|uniref:Dof-type domain-containing protein n=1 Tax=Panicum virgatum TaxID=38727 RepID=A0A8T0NPT1_PANVG|nr:hypothetical protein PVAP13_9KG387700 [Panicum virgatum]
MLDATSRRRKQTTKEDLFSTMPQHGSRIIPADHGGAGRGGGKEAHRNKQHHHQLPGAPPMAPHPGIMPTDQASMSAGDGSSSCSPWVKPGCMMELARLDKIPPPESGLPCPRCRSADTKFCYYNNYSLSQPRHFCRACRRYWTHGGALRDFPFSTSAARRNSKPAASNKHHEPPSMVASCCASGTGGGAASPSSSSGTSAAAPGGGGRAAAAAAMAVTHAQPLEQLASLAVGAESHRTVASRLWLPGHRSSQQDHPLGYCRQLGNITGAATTAIRLEVERQWYPPPQRQPLSFLGYINAAVAAPPTPAAGLLGASDAGVTTEAGSFAGGQMQAAMIICRVPGSAALTTEPAAASEMMAGNPPLPSTETTTGTLTTTSSPGEFLVESGLSPYFLGSGGSWACSYGSCSAGNDGGGGGSTSCTAAPGTSVWPDPSGLTSSSSGTIL